MLTLHVDNLVVPMNERDREKIKDFVHVSFFILVQVLVITEYLFTPKKVSDIFWFCNHASILYAYAFYKGRPQMAIGIMQVGILVQILWLIGFVSHMLGFEGLTIASYMFDGPFDYAKSITLMVHILLPISLIWFLRKEKPYLISLCYSAIYGAILYTSAVLLTPVHENVNCVFAPCSSFVPEWGYTLLWPVYTGSMVFLTHWVYSLLYRFFHRQEGYTRSLHPILIK